MLHTDATGTGPKVVLLHGFTQTGASWKTVARALADHHEVVTLDLPGHGGSSDAPADLWGTASAVADAAGAGTYIGYSLGGRVALHVALARPEVVERLVLVSATAGIDDVEERDERRRSDGVLADRIEQIGVEAFLGEWLAQPIFAGLAVAAAGLEDRRANTTAGLAASLRVAGTGRMDPPLWGRLDELDMPVLVVAGEHDAKFRRLGARLVLSTGTNAELIVVADSGHAVPFEQPERFVVGVRRWFDNQADSANPKANSSP